MKEGGGVVLADVRARGQAVPESEWGGIMRNMDGSRSILAVGMAAVLGTACYAPPGALPGGRGVLTADSATAAAIGAPRVRIFTEYEPSAVRLVRTRLRLDQDAYVLIVNVAPDGSARIVFPESPDDPGFLRGGSTYALAPFFGGYPTVSLAAMSSQTGFVRYGHSANASIAARGPGYAFVLASRQPFALRDLEMAGLFDGEYLGSSVYDFEPETLIPAFAEIALGSTRNYAVRVDWARYAGYDPMAGYRSTSAFASAFSARSYCSHGIATRLTFFTGAFSEYDRDCPGRRPQYFFRPPVVIPVVPRDSSTDSTAAPRDTSRRGPGTISPLRRFAGNSVTAENEVELTPKVREQMRKRDKFVERRFERQAAAKEGPFAGRQPPPMGPSSRPARNGGWHSAAESGSGDVHRKPPRSAGSSEQAAPHDSRPAKSSPPPTGGAGTSAPAPPDGGRTPKGNQPDHR